MGIGITIGLGLGLGLGLSAEARAAEAGAVVGQPAPDFALTGLDGKEVKLSSLRGKIVVLEWFNPGCPFVQHAHGPGGALEKLSDEAMGKGVAWFAINSGAEGKQGHGLEVNREAAASWSMDHPVLLDPTGEVGRRYGATTTPHMYVIDAAGKLVYRGAIDNRPLGKGEGAAVNYVDKALADLAAGRPVATPDTKPYGCSVKY